MTQRRQLSLLREATNLHKRDDGRIDSLFVSWVKHSLRSTMLKRGPRFGANPLQFLRRHLPLHLHLLHQTRKKRKQLQKRAIQRRIQKVPKQKT